jgi:glycosyltransferase involved in cell wall biosynthesis
VHGSDVLVAGKNKWRRRRIAEALRECDGVVAVGRDLAEHVVRLGVKPDRVHVVYNGVDRELFCEGDRSQARAALGLAEDKRMVLFVGNLLLSKGAGILIEACRRLRGHGVDFHCWLVGQGRDERTLRALVARHGLRDQVRFAGPYPHAQLPLWYRASDVVALPSFSEGVPNVLREALACGRPFVATRVGGVPEVAPAAFSRLVAPGEPGALADALEEVLRAPRAPEFQHALPAPMTWEESARQLAERLEEIAGRGAYRRPTPEPSRGVTPMAAVP